MIVFKRRVCDVTLHPRRSNFTGVTCQFFITVVWSWEKLQIATLERGWTDPFKRFPLAAWWWTSFMCDCNELKSEKLANPSTPVIDFWDTTAVHTQQINTCSRTNFSSQVTAACLEKSIYPPHLWQLFFFFLIISFCPLALCVKSTLSAGHFCVLKDILKNGATTSVQQWQMKENSVVLCCVSISILLSLTWRCSVPAWLLSFLKVSFYSHSSVFRAWSHCRRTCASPQGSQFAPSYSWHLEHGLQQLRRPVQVITLAIFRKLKWKSWLVASWLQTLSAVFTLQIPQKLVEAFLSQVQSTELSQLQVSVKMHAIECVCVCVYLCWDSN